MPRPGGPHPPVSCAGRVGGRDAGPGSQAPGPSPAPMGATPGPGCPLSGPCCLDAQDTLILLMALTLLVQLALKILALILRQLWGLLTGLGGVFLPRAPPLPATRKPRCPTHDPCPPSPRLRCPPPWGLPHGCRLCPGEPIRLTMDVNVRRAPQDAPRAASAPSALPRPTPPTVSRGTDPRPGPGVHFRPPSPEEPAPADPGPRSQRPTKVYIYPVHPETPPRSRDPSPGHRALPWEEGAGGGAGQSRGAEKLVPPGARARYVQTEESPTQDWVYRPIKEPQWNWNQVG